MSQTQIPLETLANISNIAKQLNLSPTDFLEKIVQGQLAVIDAETLEDLLDVRDAIEAEADTINRERVSLATVKQELGI
ncbi:MAG: hypothetical protein ACO36E_10745 [Synechocystis sp.]